MQINLRNLCLALITVAVAFTSGVAQTKADKTLAPYFVVQGDPSVDHLPLKDTRVEISVSGVIADVKVRQIYSNEGSRPINASYVFPASTRAAVYSMRMQIGDEIIVAKIKEREQAKQEFETAKREGKSASLLEQSRPNVFTMNVANVLPGDTIAVELKYTELLVPTDGVYEFAAASFIADNVQQHAHDLDAAARVIVAEALERGSTDNVTAHIVRVDALPTRDPNEIHQQLTGLPFPPMLEARTMFDGYRIVRKLHASSRSHVYLAVDAETYLTVVIKTPSIDLQGDPAYLERFLMEEWIARRITSAHVLKPCLQSRQRNYLYIVTEFVDGQTLTQWMIDNPKPELEAVRRIVEQIGKGLQAFHRMEMLHQDMRPENIMIDITGTVKIIDFGSTRVAGVVEMATPAERTHPLGTVQYTAPEYFLGEPGSMRSDIFSLGVIACQMLTGKLPYGAEAARARTRAAQRKLRYRSSLDEHRDIPAWIDLVLRKAVHPDPLQRYAELSEFIYDLRHPNKELMNEKGPALAERNPLVFWQCVCFVLTIVIAILLFKLK